MIDQAVAAKPEAVRPVFLRTEGPPSAAARRLARVSRIVIRPSLVLLFSVYGLLIKLGFSAFARSSALHAFVSATDWLAFVLPAIRGSSVTKVRLDNCRAEEIRAPGVQPGGAVILYFHGGGLVAGGFHTHRRLLSRLSSDANATVLSVGYRLLIKNQFSDAVSDGFDGYAWLLAAGYDPAKIVMAGDSGGGGLAVSVAAECRDQGLPVPAGLMLLSPWADFDASAKLAHPNVDTDPTIPVRRGWPMSGGQVAEYLLGGSPAAAARLSPLRTNLDGLPPALIHVGGTEVLLADAEGLAAAFGRSGVPVTCKTWEGLIHVFQLAADFVPEGRESLEELGAFVREATSATSANLTKAAR